MKPVAIFRHSRTEGPGYFATWLDRAGIEWELVRVDAGDPIPSGPGRHSGLVFMGGPMSVNDDLPWIPPALHLIATAVARDVPVLGHCLGGQLMSKALGGLVQPAIAKEIGWGEVEVTAAAEARDWFGAGRDHFVSFHWHGETFSIPRAATALLSSPWCENQAFALGPHLAMQCHIEMTEELVRSWCETGRREIERSAGPAVQPVDQILERLQERVHALQAVADAVYARWAQGLRD
jgi:GMP synthase-like glutamine amidotransferase